MAKRRVKKGEQRRVRRQKTLAEMKRVKKRRILAASVFVMLILIPGAIMGYHLNDRNGNSGDERSTNNSSDGDESGTTGFNRVVLIETFTAVDCYWCNAEEEPALKEIAQDYGKDEAIIIAYHGFYGDDPYETAEGNGRGDYYGGISGTPNVWVDGVLNRPGATGKGVEAMYNVYAGFISQRLPKKTYVSLRLSGAISEGAVQITVIVNGTEEIDTTVLFVRLALVEDSLEYSGNSFDWVLRDLKGRSIGGGGLPLSIEESFELDGDWNEKNLGVAAWLQGGADREVLQAAFYEL